MSSTSSEPQDAGDDINRNNTSDSIAPREHQANGDEGDAINHGNIIDEQRQLDHCDNVLNSDNVDAHPVEGTLEVNPSSPQKKVDRLCSTPQRDVLEMPTILTPMLRRELKSKEQASCSKGEHLLLNQTQPQVKTILRTSDSFRASPILKSASRDGADEHRDNSSPRNVDKHLSNAPLEVQRPTPQKVLHREGYAYPPPADAVYPHPQPFPYEYHPHYSSAPPRIGRAASNDADDSDNRKDDSTPNIISPSHPFPPNHPGYNRYHQYSSSSGHPHRPCYADRPSHHQIEGTVSESFDYGTPYHGHHGPPPGYWSSHPRSPPRRAHSYESTSSSTGMHYSPVKPQLEDAATTELPSTTTEDEYESNSTTPKKSESGGIWKPRLSEYPSPPRFGMNSWDYGEISAEFTAPYSGPPPPPHFSPAGGGAHYNPGGYLPSPRGGWDISRHPHAPPHSPYSSFRYLVGSQSWDSEDNAPGEVTLLKPNHLRQLLPKSSEEQDNDILDDDKQPSVSQGESDSSNRRDQSFAPRYSYTFSGSFGGSFDQDDAVTNSSCKPTSSNMAPPPRTPTHTGAPIPYPGPQYPPPESWYYGGGGAYRHPHNDPYGGLPPPVHYSPGRGKGVGGSMMWGGPMNTPARGGPYPHLPSHVHASSGIATNTRVRHPKVTPTTTEKKKVVRTPASSIQSHSSLPSSAMKSRSSFSPTAEFNEAVEFTKARLQQLLVLHNPSKANSGAGKDFPPVIMLPATPHILVDDIRSNDVLLGRGGGTNTQAGNRRFRGIVNAHQPIYLTARRKEKPLIARCIVEWIREQGGKFLKKDEASGKHFDVGCERAEAKTSQALREGLDVRATKNAAGSLINKNPTAVPVKAASVTTANKEKTSSSSNSNRQNDSLVETQEQHLLPEPRGWVEGGVYGPPPYGYYHPPRPNLYEASRRIRGRGEGIPYHGPPPPHPGYSTFGPPLSYYGGPPDGRSPKRIKWANTPDEENKPPPKFPAVPTVLSDEDKLLFKEFSPPPSSALAVVAPSYDQGEAADL